MRMGETPEAQRREWRPSRSGQVGSAELLRASSQATGGFLLSVCLLFSPMVQTLPKHLCEREGEQEIAGGLFNNNSHWGGKRMFVCNYIPVTTQMT